MKEEIKYKVPVESPKGLATKEAVAYAVRELFAGTFLF